MTYGEVKGTEMNTLTSFRAIEAQEVAANLELYLEYGAETRAEYLAMLSEDFDVDLDTVMPLPTFSALWRTSTGW